MKLSGNARELGAQGLESFRQAKHVHLDAKAGKAWWSPYRPGGYEG